MQSENTTTMTTTNVTTVTPPWDRDTWDGKEVKQQDPPPQWDRDSYGPKKSGKVHPETPKETPKEMPKEMPKRKVMPVKRRRNWGSDTESDSE